MCSKGFGTADLARGIAVTDSTLYRVASISKSVTALALMLLYDQGLFQLGEDVSSYLGFSLRNPSHPNTPITFRMLLSHTSFSAYLFEPPFCSVFCNNPR